MNKSLSVIGNEVRIKLILCLSKKPKNVTSLIENCGLSQSAVSQHLEKLKEAKMVKAKRIGKEVFYEIAKKDVLEIATKLDRFSKKYR